MFSNIIFWKVTHFVPLFPRRRQVLGLNFNMLYRGSHLIHHCKCSHKVKTVIAWNRQQTHTLKYFWLDWGRPANRPLSGFSHLHRNFSYRKSMALSKCLPWDIGTYWCALILHSMAFVLSCVSLSKEKRKKELGLVDRSGKELLSTFTWTLQITIDLELNPRPSRKLPKKKPKAPFYCRWQGGIEFH